MKGCNGILRTIAVLGTVVVVLSVLVDVSCKKESEWESAAKRIVVLDERLKDNPRDTLALFERERLHNQRGEWHESLADLTTLIQMGTHDPDAYALRSLVFYYAHCYDFAIQDSKHVIALGRKGASNLCARCFWLCGRPDSAMAYYQLGEQNGEADYSAEVASCAFVLGRYDTAIARWEGTLKGIVPILPFKRLAAAACQKGDYVLAKKYVDSMALAPEKDTLAHAHFRYYRGLVLLRCGDIREAIADLEAESTSLDLGSFAEVYLAEAYSGLHDDANAREHLSRAVAKGIPYPDIVQHNMRLRSDLERLLPKASTESKLGRLRELEREKRIYSQQDADLAYERMTAIFANPSFREEYRLLYEIIMRAYMDNVELELWKWNWQHPCLL